MRYAPTQAPVFTLTTGPVDAYPAVLRGLASPVLYDYDPMFQAAYQRICEKLAPLVRSETVPVILHGEPIMTLEAAVASLVAKGDVVLNLVSGVYGKGLAPWIERAGGVVETLAVPYDRVIDPAEVAAVLQARPEIAVVSVCHHDTPSGTINPVEAIGKVVAEHGKLLLVDAVSSFAGMSVDAENSHADLFVTGPNKCMGCPPGLSILGVSRNAWAKMKANPDAPRASMLSILDWEEAWRADRPFPFTPSVAEVNGLEAAIDLYVAEGPEAVWSRHALTAAACRAGVLAMGLEIWPAEERFASPTATAVTMPAGVDEQKLRDEARARYGVVFSSGRGETAGKLTRIGHMGPTAQPIYAIAALAALGGALTALGHAVDTGKGVTAALAVIDAG